MLRTGIYLKNLSHSGQIDEIDHDLNNLLRIDQIDHDLDHPGPSSPLRGMLCRICLVQIRPRLCRICLVQIRPRKDLVLYHAGYMGPTRQHELYHTDHTDHTDRTDHENCGGNR